MSDRTFYAIFIGEGDDELSAQEAADGLRGFGYNVTLREVEGTLRKTKDGGAPDA